MVVCVSAFWCVAWGWLLGKEEEDRVAQRLLPLEKRSKEERRSTNGPPMWCPCFSRARMWGPCVSRLSESSFVFMVQSME
jgi:hypothetical protein